jgi:alkylated DNA repair dioxygenase AlkB
MSVSASTFKFPKPLPLPPKEAITLTYGDVAENHVRMQKVGSLAAEGFDEKDLAAAKDAFEKIGVKCELIALAPAAGGEADVEGAWVLIARGGVSAFTSADELFKEQQALEWDTKALMYGQVRNKHARHNLCYAEEAQEPDYEQGKGRLVAFKGIPHTAAVRAGLEKFFGAKAHQLQCEGNRYFDAKKCGIGWHGDSERRKVIGVRLGASIPLVFHWFHERKPMGDTVELKLGHGDLYCMSAKAVGTDWKKRKVPTLRHAAGCEKYIAM